MNANLENITTQIIDAMTAYNIKPEHRKLYNLNSDAPHFDREITDVRDNIVRFLQSTDDECVLWTDTLGQEDNRHPSRGDFDKQLLGLFTPKTYAHGEDGPETYDFYTTSVPNVYLFRTIHDEPENHGLPAETANVWRLIRVEQNLLNSDWVSDTMDIQLVKTPQPLNAF